MFPVAHVLLSLVATKRFWQANKLDWRFIAVGSLLPDLVDKAIFLLFHTGNGRFIAHTLVSVLIGFLVFQFISLRVGKSVALGMLLHLVFDLNAEVPWFYPFVSYEFPPRDSLNIFQAYLSFFGIGTDAIAVALGMLSLRGAQPPHPEQQYSVWEHSS